MGPKSHALFHIYSGEKTLILFFFFFFHLSDHALAGHVVHTTVVMDEFECQLKCMGTKRCKSAINVLPGDCIGQRNSELKNKTR